MSVLTAASSAEAAAVCKVGLKQTRPIKNAVTLKVAKKFVSVGVYWEEYYVWRFDCSKQSRDHDPIMQSLLHVWHVKIEQESNTEYT